MKNFWLIAFLSVCVSGCLAGCANFSTKSHSEERVRIRGVVEEYDPESLVFYPRDSLLYDSISRVSRVRVETPWNLRGRVIAIDLQEASEEKDGKWPELRKKGSIVSFEIPEALITPNERSLIPIDLATK